jgi:hypothetical protein
MPELSHVKGSEAVAMSLLPKFCAQKLSAPVLCNLASVEKLCKCELHTAGRGPHNWEEQTGKSAGRICRT